jgi:hypothetical protein
MSPSVQPLDCGFSMVIIYKTAQGCPRRKQIAETEGSLGPSSRIGWLCSVWQAQGRGSLLACGDALEGLAGNLSRAGDSKFNEAAPAMRPAERFSHVRHA